MAQFQTREYHTDQTEKRPMTTGDILFLTELQKELNTQPSMGNADPLFWVIAQTKERPTSEDFADAKIIVDTETGDTIARSMAEFANYLDNGEIDAVTGCTYFNQSCTIKFANGTKSGAYDLDDMLNALRAHGIDRFELAYISREVNPVPDTLFLTHRDCEEHLDQYSYNYEDDAHAFAMTAIRSPRYEALLRLIRTVDWSKFIVQGPGGVV